MKKSFFKHSRRGLTYDFDKMEAYAQQQRDDALKLVADFNLGLLPDKIDDALTFTLSANNITITLYMPDYRKLINLKNGEKIGQITVEIENYILKNDLEMDLNYTNYGHSPFDKEWDHTPIPTLKAGTIVRFHACEYAVGYSGTIIYHKFHKNLKGEIIDKILEKNRNIIVKRIFKINQNENNHRI